MNGLCCNVLLIQVYALDDSSLVNNFFFPDPLHALNNGSLYSDLIIRLL